MNIGLIDVDSHNFPNLALMKISAFHKQKGDNVEWHFGLSPEEYDIVYMSKVFDKTYSPDIDEPFNAKQIIKGGTGYGLDNKLPEEIEHMHPDYSLYPELTKNTAFGFLTRGCPRHCSFCIVGDKEGLCSIKVSDLSEWYDGQKYITLLDPNITACPDFYVLIEQLSRSNAWVDFTQGIDCRLLSRKKIDSLNQVKTKMIHFAWDFMQQSDKVLEGLELYSKHGAIQDFRRRRVYVLCNYDTSMEDNLYRVYKLRDMGYDPYVMIYDKPNAPREVRLLQRWANNKAIFRQTKTFDEYDSRLG